MYKRVFEDQNGKKWERTDKRKARNIYAAGGTVAIIPDNFRPFTMWGNTLLINKCEDMLQNREYSALYFDQKIREFETYNCVSIETGYHAAYYTEVKKNV